MQKEILTVHDLAIGADEVLIKNITVALYPRDRIGLIGPNGSGKTTLLKTLANLEEPFSGSIYRSGEIQYVHQLNPTHTWGDVTILGYAKSLGASPEEALEFLKKNFELSLGIENKMSQLSGGQQSLLGLACAFIKNPACILLDEPTNHIDLHARKALVGVIDSFPGAVICVSHDTYFLEKITKKLLIVKDGKLETFTGSYREYQDALLLVQESRERQLESSKKEKKKILNSITRENVRAERSKKEGKKQSSDRSMSRMEIGNFKNRAEGVAGKNKKRLDALVEKVDQKIATLSTKKKKGITVSLESADDSKNVLHLYENTVFVGEKKIASNITFDLKKGERIAIVGSNGSGKSALAKSIVGMNEYRIDPALKINRDLRVEYIDQHYALVDRNKTVFENVRDFSSEQRERIREHLSHFLLGERKDVEKKASELSGGMLARLAFVMVTIAPIDLLILDEPTNNLDMETVSSIEEILQDFNGGLIVISHDINFLKNLHVNKAYSLDKKFHQIELGDIEQ